MKYRRSVEPASTSPSSRWHNDLRRRQQLDDNLKAGDVSLSASEIAAIDAAAPPTSTYPAWMVARQSGDRQVGAGAISALPKR